MIITIDFDCTLFPTLEKVIEIYNKKYNNSIEIDQIKKYSLYESFPKEVSDKLFEIFWDEETYQDLYPYDNAIDVVKSLVVKGHNVYIATATTVKELGWKENLLQKYFPFIPKNNLIRIYHKNLLKTDVIIDDYLDNLINSDAIRICLDYPWNRNEQIEQEYNIHRAFSWHDILNIIERKI